MEIENKTREQVIIAMAKYITNTFKTMKGTNARLNIDLSNWGCGNGRNWEWTNSKVRVGNDTYIFKDKEISDTDMIRMANDAIALTKVRAKVFSETYGDGFWLPQETQFKYIEIYAKPCKEFVSLQKLLEKYANFTLHETDVFDVAVCGKRSSWSDSGEFYYLCYNEKKCQSIIAYIRGMRGSKDTISVKLEEYFSHGDEMDYKCAMYHESEWYGGRGTKLVVTIKTPKGKVKGEKTFALTNHYYD